MATVTHRALLSDTAATTTGTSASFTPAVGDLLVVFVTVSGTLLAGNLTGTGAGLTFTRVCKTTSRTSADSVYCFVSDQFVSAAVAQTVTFTPNAAATGMIIHVASVASMSRSGRDAIRQYTSDGSHATGTPTLTFPAVCLTGNVVMGAIGGAQVAMSPPTSFTEGADSTYATPTTGMEYVYRNSGHTAATVVWTSSATTYGGIAIELDTSAAGSLPAKAATLTDAFATQDAAKWTYAGTASASGGVGILPVQAGYAESSITAVARYDLIASEFSFSVPQINTNANADGPFLTIELHGGTFADGTKDRLTWFIYANTIAAAYKNGPTETTLYSGGVPGTIGPYYRIRESGGTVYWDSSTNGTSWTNRASVALTSIAFSLSSLRISFRAQAADANGTPYNIDNVNPVAATLNRPHVLSNNPARIRASTW